MGRGDLVQLLIAVRCYPRICPDRVLGQILFRLMGLDIRIIHGVGMVVQETTRLLATQGLVPLSPHLGPKLPECSSR